MHKLKCETTYVSYKLVYNHTMVGTLTIYSPETPIIVTRTIVNYYFIRTFHT